MSICLSAEHPRAEMAEVLARYGSLLDRLAGSAGVDPRRSALVDEAGEVWSRPGFDTVLSQSRLCFTPFDYQLATMQTVLRRMRGRAILADEVGLGKTIEAGLVLSELRMRGLADRALVVTPAGLVGQWCEELERKFALPTTVAARGGKVFIPAFSLGRTQIVAHFLVDGGAALNHRINNEPASHVLPQFGIVNGRSLSFSGSVPTWARGNAYVAPNMYDRSIPLGIYESFWRRLSTWKVSFQVPRSRSSSTTAYSSPVSRSRRPCARRFNARRYSSS